MKTPVLDKPSEYFRTAVARGIAVRSEKAIDRTGGKYGAGVIRGFSMIARGEALGHGMWIDSEMLQQVANATNNAELGVKSRFTHPSLSGDGLGKMTAKAFSASVDGDLVRADAHFLESAHDTPDGDLAGYVMDLATEAPEDFGASISFRRDIEAEEEFMRTHGAKQKTDDDGYRYWDLSEFKSPDPRNTNNLRHARLKSLRAVDFVDSPAANPSGLFHEGPFELLENGEKLLDYVFGLVEHAPDVHLGDVDPSRLKGFLHRWAESRKFEICVGKETEMTVATPAAPPADANLNTNAPPAAPTAPVSPTEPALTSASPQAAASPTTQPAAPPAETSAATGDQPVEGEKPAELSATPAPAPATPSKPAETVDHAAQFRAGLKEFTDRFGFEKGAKWFQEGKSLDECKDLHIADLAAENAAAKKQIEAAQGLGEEKPLSGTAGATEENSEFTILARRMGSESLARAALAQKCPQPSKN